MSGSDSNGIPQVTTAPTPGSNCQRVSEIQGLLRFDKDVDKSTFLYFQDISIRLTHPLMQRLEKTRKQFRPIAIRLMVLGKDESSAKPYIVVFCPECVKETVKKFFQGEEAKYHCQRNQPGLVDFEVIVEGQPPRTMTGNQPPPFDIAPGNSTGSHHCWPLATPIKINITGETRYATMGGFVVAIDNDGAPSIYGMTAGHAIIQDVVNHNDQREYAVEGSSTGSDHDFNRIEAEGDISEKEIQHGPRPPIDVSYKRYNESKEEEEWSPLGHVAQASFSYKACNRDWALVEGIERLGWRNRPKNNDIERYFLNDIAPGLTNYSDRIEISHQPPFFGTLSRLPSLALLPFGHDFVRVHIVQLQDGHSKWT